MSRRALVGSKTLTGGANSGVTARRRGTWIRQRPARLFLVAEGMDRVELCAGDGAVREGRQVVKADADEVVQQRRNAVEDRRRRRRQWGWAGATDPVLRFE